MSNEGALANLDVDAALAEIRNGTIARQIASRYGVQPQSLRDALRKAKPEEYKQAVADQCEHWIDESTDEMNNLEADKACIARARARGEWRFKLAGVLNPKYAPKSMITNVNINVEQALGFDADSLVDKLRTFTNGGNSGGNSIDVESTKVIESVSYDADSVADSATDEPKSE
jgi:hypothetical protein